MICKLECFTLLLVCHSNFDRTRLHSQANRRSICHSCFPFTQDDDIGKDRYGYGVRWMGNEEGVMPLPSWSCVKRDQSAPWGGDPYGVFFEPASVDTVLREHYW